MVSAQGEAKTSEGLEEQIRCLWTAASMTKGGGGGSLVRGLNANQTDRKGLLIELIHRCGAAAKTPGTVPRGVALEEVLEPGDPPTTPSGGSRALPDDTSTLANAARTLSACEEVLALAWSKNLPHRERAGALYALAAQVVNGHKEDSREWRAVAAAYEAASFPIRSGQPRYVDLPMWDANQLFRALARWCFTSWTIARALPDWIPLSDITGRTGGAAPGGEHSFAACVLVVHGIHRFYDSNPDPKDRVAYLQGVVDRAARQGIIQSAPRITGAWQANSIASICSQNAGAAPSTSPGWTRQPSPSASSSP